MNGAGLGSKYFEELEKTVQTERAPFAGRRVRATKHHALAFVGESKMLGIPIAHLITVGGLEEDAAYSKDAARAARL